MHRYLELTDTLQHRSDLGGIWQFILQTALYIEKINQLIDGA
jgi:hypothetical protein